MVCAAALFHWSPWLSPIQPASQAPYDDDFVPEAATTPAAAPEPAAPVLPAPASAEPTAFAEPAHNHELKAPASAPGDPAASLPETAHETQAAVKIQVQYRAHAVRMHNRTIIDEAHSNARARVAAQVASISVPETVEGLDAAEPQGNMKGHS